MTLDWSASARLSLRLLLGAVLLAVLAYRLYRRRPALQVPATADEIAAYKRTGRFARPPGYSFYSIDYGGRLDRLTLPALACAGVAALAAVLCASLARAWLPMVPRNLAVGGFTGVAFYAAALAGLLVYERGTGRLRRRQRLLTALALPAQARVLDLGGCLGFMGIGAALSHDSVHATILTAPAAIAATRINARRAGVATRVTVIDSPAALADSLFDAVLVTEVLPGLELAAARRWLRAGAPVGLCQSRRSRPLDLGGRTIVALDPSLPERGLRLLSAGCVQPWAGIARPLTPSD